MNTMNSSLERARKQINSVDETPMITLNQQNNTVILDTDSLDRDSKKRVADAVKSILKKLEAQKNLDESMEITEESPVLNNDTSEDDNI